MCPLRFRIVSPRVVISPQELLLTSAAPRSILGCTSVSRNSWGGDPESLGANRSAYYPREQSLFVEYIITCKAIYQITFNIQAHVVSLM